MWTGESPTSTQRTNCRAMRQPGVWLSGYEMVGTMVTVMNLETGDKQQFTCSPREACIAAYAQSMNDYSTWLYKRYSSLVEENSLTVLCGNFSAYKDGREF